MGEFLFRFVEQKLCLCLLVKGGFIDKKELTSNKKLSCKKKEETIKDKALTKGDVIDRLKSIANSNTNDAIFLMSVEEKLSRRRIEKLDLAGVSSISYSAKGGYKLEFYDKIRVLELLYSYISRDDDSRGLETFISALESTTKSSGLNG